MQPLQPQRFVAYYRVSTQKQGQSGLGLEAQQNAVAAMHGEIIAEFTEIESGKRNDRPELAAALAHAKANDATLVIAKLDRLARRVAFIANLIEAGVPIRVCDLPDASIPMLQMMSVFAEMEAAEISKRTKAALAAAKARGVKLGGAYESKQAQADAFAETLRAEIQTLTRSGITTPAALAKALNQRNVRTSRGTQWGTGQVIRLLRRLG